MEIVIENQPNCLAHLRVEVPADVVSRMRETMITSFAQHARIPGFRPGKTPRATIEKRFAREIQNELESDLVNDALQEAISKKNLRMLSVESVTSNVPTPDGGYHLDITVVTTPEFELPDYSSIPSNVKFEPVTDQALEEMMEAMRQRHGDFEMVEGRPAALGDYVVASYSGTLDGVPLTKAVPTAPEQFSEKNQTWILLQEGILFPGFIEQIVGMETGAQKSFAVTFPEDVDCVELRGKVVEYSLTLHTINTMTLPEWSDDLAKKIAPDETMETLRAKTRSTLEDMAKRRFETAKQNAAIEFLLSKVEYEVPEGHIAEATRSTLQKIVEDYQNRGVTDEELKTHEEVLISSARKKARDRVRTGFLLQRIATQEKLKATEQELTAAIIEIAFRHQIPVKQFLADIKKQRALPEIEQDILAQKALRLLESRVVTDTPETDTGASATAAPVETPQEEHTQN